MHIINCLHDGVVLSQGQDFRCRAGQHGLNQSGQAHLVIVYDVVEDVVDALELSMVIKVHLRNEQ